jgi:chorismate mutase
MINRRVINFFIKVFSRIGITKIEILHSIYRKDVQNIVFLYSKYKALRIQKLISETTRPFVIAGPCSAETEEQVFTISKQVADYKLASVLRAGIWKPRTRPDSFEGVGEVGLKWLVDAGKSVGLPVATEVANKTHVELAMKAGVDILWIGARTTVNPFAVQEIADALTGTQIPILIKNPVNPDLELWIGAFERLEKAGLTDLAAIHRGFSVYKHPKYRNVPNWEIPIALKERRPDLSIICDPSHITGNRSLIAEVSQKAMDLNFEGLMIETHNNPDQAWSDSAQQVTVDKLNLIIQNLVLRTSQVSNEFASYLIEVREKIDILDDRLFDLLTARMTLSEEVGQFKRENNIMILQQEHWARIINKRLDLSAEYHLSEKFVRQFMDAIHQESIRHQIKVMNPKSENDSSK